MSALDGQGGSTFVQQLAPKDGGCSTQPDKKLADVYLDFSCAVAITYNVTSLVLVSTSTIRLEWRIFAHYFPDVSVNKSRFIFIYFFLVFTCNSKQHPLSFLTAEVDSSKQNGLFFLMSNASYSPRVFFDLSSN